MFAPLNLQYFTQSNLTSPYGMRDGRLHKGIDIGVPIGSPVYSILDGRVSLNRADSHHPTAAVGYGWYVIIDHANGMQSLYAHLDAPSNLKMGDLVYGGQPIGNTGMSGNTTGPHLHFEIRKNGVAEDPTPYFPHIFTQAIVQDEIVTTEQLFQRISQFKWERQVTKIHPHHTYKPNKANYTGSNGAQLNQNMRDYHVNTRKFADIAQHLTLLPDGKWVIGRDWNKIPASMAGNNTGAFMTEMIGDFHTGRDKLEGPQLEAILDWVVFCMDFFGLPESAIHFHREYSATSCPGSSIEKKWFLQQVREHRSKPTASPVIAQNQYFPDMNNSHPYIKGVDSLWEKGILKGHHDGRLIPDQLLFKVELAALLGRSLRYITTFYMQKDVEFVRYTPMEDHWAQRYVGVLEEISLLEGLFEPYDIVQSSYASGKIVSIINWLFNSAEVRNRVDFVGNYGEFWLFMAKKSDVGKVLQKLQISRVEGVALVAHALDFIINEHLAL